MSDEKKPETWEEEARRKERERLAEHRAWVLAHDLEIEKLRQAADTLNHERIKERDRLVREMMDATAMREQTAATILAALIQAHATANQHNGHVADLPDSYAKAAVAWADALRAELAKGGKP